MSAGPALTSLLQPVQPPTAFEQTVERLAAAIKLGLLVPGDQLPPERELAERLQISRTTLRQALTALTQSGLVTSARGRHGGTFVADPLPVEPRPRRVVDQDEMRRMLDFRLAVEAGAVIRAAERATEEDLDRLLGLTEQMDRAAEFEDYRRADMLFHVGLAEAAQSTRLVEAMTQAHAGLDEAIELVPHPAEVLRRSNDQHRQIVARLRKRDAIAAVALIREHVEGTEHFLYGMLPASIAAPGQIASK